LIKYASQAFLKRTGYTKDEIYGQTHRILRSPKVDEKIYTTLKKKLQEDFHWEGEFLNVDKDGNEYWVFAVIEALLSKTGQIIGYQAISEDITDKKMVKFLSETDVLTQIYNRRKIEVILDYSIKQLNRNKENLSILLIDIDNFKSVNDLHGHEMGYIVLQKFAQIIKDSVRQNDSFGRWGGEEFVVVLSATNQEGAMIVSEKIRTNLEKHIFPDVGIKTCSIGLYEVTPNDDLKSAISNADKAMYEAKISGKNKTVVYKKGLK